MSLPEPRPGLVIRYSFLWSHEAAAGAEEAAKDRPCAIVIAAELGAPGEMTVIVAPVTHEAPDDPGASLEVPRAISRRLGFDDGRHWLRFDELNQFVWPGFDLRRVPGRRGAYDYGMLPRGLFERLRRAILERQRSRKASPPTRRD
ncbi:MAG: hypothetical protein WD076_07950 [Parvularculaceae bacterium]